MTEPLKMLLNRKRHLFWKGDLSELKMLKLEVKSDMERMKQTEKRDRVCEQQLSLCLSMRSTVGARTKRKSALRVSDVTNSLHKNSVGFS